MVIGGLAVFVRLWGVHGLKRLLNVDDSLDVFGVLRCRCGILGALLTGVFASPDLGGTGVWDYVANAVGPYSIPTQVKIQLSGVTTIVWFGVVLCGRSLHHHAGGSASSGRRRTRRSGSHLPWRTGLQLLAGLSFNKGADGAPFLSSRLAWKFSP